MSSRNSSVGGVPPAKRARVAVGTSEPTAGVVGRVNGVEAPREVRQTFSRGAVVKLRLENFL